MKIKHWAVVLVFVYFCYSNRIAFAYEYSINQYFVAMDSDLVAR